MPCCTNQNKQHTYGRSSAVYKNVSAKGKWRYLVKWDAAVICNLCVSRAVKLLLGNRSQVNNISCAAATDVSIKASLCARYTSADDINIKHLKDASYMKWRGCADPIWAIAAGVGGDGDLASRIYCSTAHNSSRLGVGSGPRWRLEGCVFYSCCGWIGRYCYHIIILIILIICKNHW